MGRRALHDISGLMSIVTRRLLRFSMVREAIMAGSWKWTVFAGLYTTALAWLMSFAIYQIGGLFL